MAVIQDNEQTIINFAYNILEQDNSYWDPTSIEYLTARGYCNLGIRRWENYNNQVWPELFTTLAQATDGTKVITAGTYQYSCPSNMVRPVSYVRLQTGSNTPVLYRVINPARLADYASSTDRICWFTGNKASGFKLNFNSNLTLATADTIIYEYVKQATYTAAVGDYPDLADSNYLSYFIAAHMSDGGLDANLFHIAEQFLDQMESKAMSGLELVPDTIPYSANNEVGFGV